MKQASEFITGGTVAATYSGRGVTVGDAVNGVVVLPISEALTAYGDMIRRVLPDLAADTAGLFIYVKNEVQVADVVRVVVDGCSPAGRCVVCAGENSKAEVVFILSDAEDFRRDAFVSTGAKILFRDIVAAGKGGYVGLNGATDIAAGAFVETVTAEIGEGETAVDYTIKLQGREANAVHYGIFIADDGEKKNFSVRVEHNVPDCKSDVMVKGVAAGNGRGSFAGMVYVAPDAQHTEAYQQSRNLILGASARILTSPQLEIYADDVKCSHGATIGQINDNALFYMRQRGLSDAQARGLQLSGFVNDILAHIGEGELLTKVSAAAQHKIDNLH